MTIGETLKVLEKADNYLLERIYISDKFIDMVKTMMPSSYEIISEKEDLYIEMIGLLKTENYAK